MNRKPIALVAGVELETRQVLKEVRIHPTGKVEFSYVDENAQQIRAWTGVHRQREMGEKTLLKTEIDPTELQMGEANALRKFSFIFAIDTNNLEIDGLNYSVAHIMQLWFISEDRVEGATLGEFVFTAVAEKQENLAWVLLCGEILSSPSHSSENTYAIITDSDLGNHDAFNKREKPIYADETLPEHFTINYASEEGTGITNQMIKRCDKLAKQTLVRISDGSLKVSGDERVVGNARFRLTRIYNNNPEFERNGWFQILRLSPLPSKA